MKMKKTVLATLMGLSMSVASIGGAEGATGDNNILDLPIGATIQATDASGLSSTNQFTLELNVKPSSLQKYTQLVNQQVSKTARVQLQLNDKKILAIVGNGGNTYLKTPDVITEPNKWYHIAMVFDGTKSSDSDKLKVYVNGQHVAFAGGVSGIPSVTADLSSADLIVGSSKFNGDIDEVRVWSAARAQEQIEFWRNKKITQATQLVNRTGLNVYWNFDQTIAGANTVIAGPHTSIAGSVSDIPLVGTPVDGLNNNSPLYIPRQSKTIYGYLPSYRIATVPDSAFDNVSHVIFKSMKPLADGSLHEHLNGKDTKDKVLPYIESIKAKVGNRPVKIIAGVGGGHASTNGEHFPEIIKSPAAITNLAKNLKNFCLDYGLDGIDINWEFPENSAEYDGWVNLMQAISAELKPAGLFLAASFKGSAIDLNASTSNNIVLSNAVPTAQNLNLALRSQDYLDLMIVQGQGRIDPDYKIHTMPVYKKLIDVFLEYQSGGQTIDKSKLLAGVPFFGRLQAPGKSVIRYTDVINRSIPDIDLEVITSTADDDVYNSVASSKYPEGTYSFVGADTNSKKASYVIDEDFGGISVWEMGNDVSSESGAATEAFSVLKALHDDLPLPAALPPAPGFNVSGSKDVNKNDSVQFTDTSSRNPVSWSWSFPGGNPSLSNSQNPTVTYSNSGSYDVTLSVTNSDGSTKQITRSAYITVN